MPEQSRRFTGEERVVGIPWKVRQSGFSAHALTRMQQRGIREEAVDMLFRYGREEHDHRGRTIIYFDKKARRRMEREMGCPHPGPPPQAGEGIGKSPPSKAGKEIDKSPRPQPCEGIETSLPRRAGQGTEKSPPPQAGEGIDKKGGFHNRPRPQANEGLLNLRIYAVLGRSGDIVTVGHRYARIRRH
jgi:hypothetical protein